jgi:hypothetical protein
LLAKRIYNKNMEKEDYHHTTFFELVFRRTVPFDMLEMN